MCDIYAMLIFCNIKEINLNKRPGNITVYFNYCCHTCEFSGVFMNKVPLFYFEETEQKRNIAGPFTD